MGIDPDCLHTCSMIPVEPLLNGGGRVFVFSPELLDLLIPEYKKKCKNKRLSGGKKM